MKSVAIAGLRGEAGAPWVSPAGNVDARRAIAWVADIGVGAIQLDATLATIRPRELDRSGRRDLAALLRRSGLVLSGLDLFIPVEHFLQPATLERALAAATGAAELIAELSALMEAKRVVSLTLPRESGTVPGLLEAIGAERGVMFADHGLPVSWRSEHVQAGVDPAALLLAGEDPGKTVSRLGVAPACARLSDADSVSRVAVGAGRLDLLEYAVALHTSGYVGRAVVDLRGANDQDAAARK